MATTSPDNIQYPVNSDQVAPLASHFKNLADSTQDALNTRAVKGEIVNADIAADADIAPSKIDGVAVTQADSGTVTGTMIADGTITGTDIDDATVESANLAEQEYIKFDTTYSGGSTQPGELAWDADNETLQFQLDPHVTLQIGQEHLIRVKNASGSVAIPNGTVVMFAGATGDTVTVSPAVSDGSISINYLVGITTEEIPSDGFGFATQLGFVNGVNTNAYNVGDILYPNPAVPGGLTATEPEAPNWKIPIAAVTKKNASSGRMLVRAIGGGGGGGASVTVEETAPSVAAPGDLWLDSNDGTLYVYYEDIDGSQWIQVQANSALGASIESRLGALESQAIAFGILSPNYIINGSFDIWQRATSTTTTTAGYRTADRWATWIDSGTGTIQQDTTNVPAFLQSGIRYTSSGANGSCVFYHTIETLNAELLAGRTVNLSAYLSGTAGKSIQISLWSSTTTDNAFSGSWNLVGATAYSNTTSVSRVSATYNIPSNAKTVQVRVYNLDKLANTEFVSFTGVQLEQGSTATSFRRNANSIQGELAACQRYFESIGTSCGSAKIGWGNIFGTTAGIVTVRTTQTMRAAPTFSITGSISSFRLHVPGISITSITALSMDNSSVNSATLAAQGGSGVTAGQACVLQSEVAGTGVWLSAEL